MLQKKIQEYDQYLHSGDFKKIFKVSIRSCISSNGKIYERDLSVVYSHLGYKANVPEKLRKQMEESAKHGAACPFIFFQYLAYCDEELISIKKVAYNMDHHINTLDLCFQYIQFCHLLPDNPDVKDIIKYIQIVKTSIYGLISKNWTKTFCLPSKFFLEIRMKFDGLKSVNVYFKKLMGLKSITRKKIAFINEWKPYENTKTLLKIVKKKEISDTNNIVLIGNLLFFTSKCGEILVPSLYSFQNNSTFKCNTMLIPRTNASFVGLSLIYVYCIGNYNSLNERKCELFHIRLNKWSMKPSITLLKECITVQLNQRYIYRMNNILAFEKLDVLDDENGWKKHEISFGILTNLEFGVIQLNPYCIWIKSEWMNYLFDFQAVGTKYFNGPKAETKMKKLNLVATKSGYIRIIFGGESKEMTTYSIIKRRYLSV